MKSPTPRVIKYEYHIGMTDFTNALKIKGTVDYIASRTDDDTKRREVYITSKIEDINDGKA